MATDTSEAGAQTCARCGASFPGWSMFCTECGQQTESSRPGAPQAATAAYQAPRRPAVRTQSNRHGTWAIVWTVAAYVMCFLFWFPAFSQAKQSRLRGEPVAGAATTVTQVGLFIFLVLQVLGVAAFFWLLGNTEPVPVSPTSTLP